MIISNQVLKRTQPSWPHNFAQFEFLLSSAGYMFLTHCFSVISENIYYTNSANFRVRSWAWRRLSRWSAASKPACDQKSYAAKTVFFGLRFCPKEWFLLQPISRSWL